MLGRDQTRTWSVVALTMRVPGTGKRRIHRSHSAVTPDVIVKAAMLVIVSCYRWILDLGHSWFPLRWLSQARMILQSICERLSMP